MFKSQALKIKEYFNRLMVVFMLFAGLGLSFFILDKLAQLQHSKVINIAGRQRALSQMIAKEALQLQLTPQSKDTKKKLEQHFQEIYSNNQSLHLGNVEEEIPAAFSSAIEKQYEKQGRVLVELEKNIQCLLQDCSNRLESIKEIQSETTDFFDRMDSIVQESVDFNRMTLFEMIIVDGGLLVLGLILAIAFLNQVKRRVSNQIIVELNSMDKKIYYTDQIEKVANIGFWSLDVKTGQTTWSDQVYRIHKVPVGTPTNKLKGIEFYAPHERPRITKYVEDCIKYKVNYDDTFEFIDDEGTHKWVRAMGTPILNGDGDVVKLVGLFQDITEMKKREEEHQIILESTGVGLWSWDLENQEIYWDDRMYQIYGINKADFSGAQEAWHSCVHPDHREEANQEFKSIIAGKQEFESTVVIRSSYKDKRYVGCRGTVNFNQEGRAVQLQGVCWDQTQEIEFQNELNEKTKLANQNARFALIGQLAAGVGHEINNPLAIIRGHLGNLMLFLEKKYSVEMGPIYKKYEIVDQAIDRISNITKGLRTFSRTDEEDLVSVDLRALLDLSLNMVSPIYGVEGIQIERMGRGFDEPVYILGNDGKLQQVIINFLSNAKDATMSEKDKRIEVHLDVSDHFVFLKIRNTGEKISSENLKRIFDPFFTTKEVGKGTGIGLTISRNIIEDFDGEISHLDEELTTFLITLPRQTEKPEALEEETVSAKPSVLLEGVKVLIAEDEPDLGEFLKERLVQLGGEVTLAEDGEKALQMFNDSSRFGGFDLVFSDMKMPRKNGLELLKGIRESDAANQPYIVLMSGGVEFDLANASDSRLQGMSDHLDKPFSDGQLIQVLSQYQERQKAAS